MTPMVEEAIFGRKLLLFDNVESEVERQMKHAKSIGMQVVFTNDLIVFWNELQLLPTGSMVFVDQHMKSINDFSEIGFNTVSTAHGANVGVAVVRGLVPLIEAELKVHVMSGFILGSRAKEEINTAIRRGSSARFVDKTNLLDFQNAITEHAYEIIGDGPTPLTSEHAHDLLEPALKRPVHIRDSDYLKRVQAVKKILDEWSQGDKLNTMACFGYVEAEEKEIDMLSDWLPTHFNSDVSLRADAIIQIKRALITIYRGKKDIGLEIQWLKTPDEHLDGNSPWDLITSGNISDLVRVAGLASKVL